MKTFERHFQKELVHEVRLEYVIYEPQKVLDDSSVESGTIWPLLIFLHGSKERSDKLDTQLLTSKGLTRELDNGRELPMIVLAPQCPSTSTWPLQTATLNALLDEVIKDFPIDIDRFYLTGMSMGGYGSWIWAASHPDRFAALAPLGGGYSWIFDFPEKVELLRDIPVWAFHGELDDVVPVNETKKLVEALRSYGGNVRMTIYPGSPHDCWTVTYRNDELYDWFLRQSKNRKSA